MIERNYFKDIENELNFKEISILIGSRQVGKTTLIKYLYNKVKKKTIYLSFDDISVLNIFENNEKLFKEQFVDEYEIIFIDEIQYSKKSGRVLKYLYDLTKKKFIVSGSSFVELSINSLSYLVGRVRIIEIYPITFREFVNYKSKNNVILFNKKRDISDFKQISNEFEEFLKYGGYPQIVTLPLKEKEKNLNFLVNTYLLKEIREILDYKNLFEFEKLLKHLALIDGGLINKSSISQDLEISTKKITEMIEALENTYIIKKVKPFISNKIKEEIKSSKIYFSDLGFKNSLLNNFNELNLRVEKGKIYENFVLNSLIKKGYEVKFWNYKNRYEMDFIIEKNGKIIGFECKSKLKNENLTNSIKEFVYKFKPFKIFIINENIDSKIKYEKTNIDFLTYFNFISFLENELDNLF